MLTEKDKKENIDCDTLCTLGVFFMELMSVDFHAVFIAAVLYMIVNFCWYSKFLFGPAWHRHCGIKESEMKDNRIAMLWGFVNALVIGYFLAFFEGYLGVTTVSDGMFVGFCLWLGFVATTQIGGVIWCKAPIKIFLINTGGKLLSLLVMSGVIGA